MRGDKIYLFSSLALTSALVKITKHQYLLKLKNFFFYVFLISIVSILAQINL